MRLLTGNLCSFGIIVEPCLWFLGLFMCLDFAINKYMRNTNFRLESGKEERPG